MDVDMTLIASVTKRGHQFRLTDVIRVRSWREKFVGIEAPVSTGLWADAAVEPLYMAADTITVHTRAGTSCVDD